jgi:amidophosphoribosyltransferase
MVKGMEAYLNKIKIERILSWGKDYDEEKLSEMINRRIRIEKIAIKDVKMRTFITEDASRNEMFNTFMISPMAPFVLAWIH